MTEHTDPYRVGHSEEGVAPSTAGCWTESSLGARSGSAVPTVGTPPGAPRSSEPGRSRCPPRGAEVWQWASWSRWRSWPSSRCPWGWHCWWSSSWQGPGAVRPVRAHRARAEQPPVRLRAPVACNRVRRSLPGGSRSTSRPPPPAWGFPGRCWPPSAPSRQAAVSRQPRVCGRGPMALARKVRCSSSRPPSRPMPPWGPAAPSPPPPTTRPTPSTPLRRCSVATVPERPRPCGQPSGSTTTPTPT